MKKILFGLVALVAAFTSCTEQEDIEIAYQTDMFITQATFLTVIQLCLVMNLK